MNIKPLLEKDFYDDGRGPDLQNVYYERHGTSLKAIEYFNPDDEYTSENLKHLLFLRTQVFMFTPEEVHSYGADVNWSEFDKAAIVCLGKSKWLKSFSQRHLDKCFHYRVVFYDDILDVICEGIEAKLGGFASVS